MEKLSSDDDDRMNLVSPIPTFFATLAKRWVSFMTGGVIVLALAVYERATGQSVPFNIYMLIAAFTVLVASYFAWHAEHILRQTAKKRLDRSQQKSKVRMQLATFLEDGRQLMARCADEAHPPPNQEVDQWAENAERFMRTNMDDSYVARFRNGAGLPMTANSIFSMPHRNLWGGIWIRTSRLQEFIREYGS